MLDIYSKYAPYKHKDVGFLFLIKSSRSKAPPFFEMKDSFRKTSGTT
jgi:hypothetical protein